MAARLTAFVVAAIVGVTFVAGLIVGAQRDDDDGTIDLLIYNGRVFTGDAESPFAEALAVRGNRIYRVGSNRDIKRLRRRATTVVDAHGGSILPGFADTYARLPVLSTDVTAPGATSEASAPVSADEARVALREAIDGAHRLGLTSLGALVEHRQALETFATLQAGALRPMRIVAAVKVAAPLAAADIDALQALRTRSDDSGLLRLDAVALDVTVPDVPDPRDGRVHRLAAAPLLAEAEQQTMLALDQRAWPLVLRIEDERELEAALDALARVIETNPAPPDGRRHRLALARPMALDTARIAQLGVTLSVPLPATWLATPEDGAVAGADPGAPESETAAGPSSPHAASGTAVATVEAPAATALPFSFPLPTGVRLVMASNALADPRLGLQALLAAANSLGAATSREGDEGAEPKVDPALLTQALATLTSAAASALGDASTRGTIAPDKLADLVILSADIFELPATRLLDAVVTTTIVDGKIVYDRETEAPQTDQE